MNKILIGLCVLLLVGISALFLVPNNEKSITGNAVLNKDIREGVKTFVVTGENFKFVVNGASNPDIKVNKGDRVRIEFTSTKGFHDWVVDEFDVATKQVRDSDGMTYVEFIADKIGTFEYYCSVGQHRANGMKGNLIVK
ncbi:MAG: plastocyanin/azurin family copper-binding protein [Nanoarchaeota archaeon]